MFLFLDMIICSVELDKFIFTCCSIMVSSNHIAPHKKSGQSNVLINIMTFPYCFLIFGIYYAIKTNSGGFID